MAVLSLTTKAIIGFVLVIGFFIYIIIELIKGAFGKENALKFSSDEALVVSEKGKKKVREKITSKYVTPILKKIKVAANNGADSITVDLSKIKEYKHLSADQIVSIIMERISDLGFQYFSRGNNSFMITWKENNIE